MSRKSGSSLSIAQGVDGIQDKAATKKILQSINFFVQTSNGWLKYGTVQLLTKVAPISAADSKTLVPIVIRRCGSLTKALFRSL
jgi:hypothetical protein